MLGREFRKDVAAHFAGERLAQGEFPPRSLGVFLREHHDAVLAFAKGELERIREPRALVSDRHEPIDDEVQRDLFHPCAGREELGFVEIFNFAVEPDALKPPLAQPRQFLAQHAGLRTQKRGEQHDAFTGALREDALDIVVERALHDAPIVPRAALFAHERPQQTRVVGHFRGGGDRAPRPADTGALLDREDRREAVNEIDVGPLELVEHLTRLGREALHVFAVALRVNRIEGQRRFPRTARPRDHDEFPARNAQLEILQVVLARAFDVDVSRGLHGSVAHACGKVSGVKARITFRRSTGRPRRHGSH